MLHVALTAFLLGLQQVVGDVVGQCLVHALRQRGRWWFAQPARAHQFSVADLLEVAQIDQGELARDFLRLVVHDAGTSIVDQIHTAFNHI